MKSTNVTVLESRWWRGKNTSVRGVFDLLSDLYCDSHHGYNYEMCNSGAGFKEALHRYVNSDPSTEYLSIACHGNESGLTVYNEDAVSRREIRNIIKRDKMNRRLVGLHFGSCSFGTQKLASFLYEEDISPWWIAGYASEVDFVQSTVLDLLFFQQVLRHKRKQPDLAIRLVSDYMRTNVGGLCDRLDFGIFVQDEETADVSNLLAI